MWQRDQEELIDEILESGIEPMIIKTASGGLEPEEFLGSMLADKRNILKKLVILNFIPVNIFTIVIFYKSVLF